MLAFFLNLILLFNYNKTLHYKKIFFFFNYGIDQYILFIGKLLIFFSLLISLKKNIYF
jgi:hypothetical protein